MNRAAWLVLARAVSQAGDVLFRVVAASAAAEATHSTWLTGLVLVGPAIASLATGGRLFADPSPQRVLRLGVAIEIARAALFAIVALSPSWPVVVLVLVASGAVQPAFDGAYGAAFATLHQGGPSARRLNAILRVGTLVLCLAASLAAPSFAASLTKAASLDALSFLSSGIALFAASRAIVTLPPPSEASAPEPPNDAAARASAIVAVYASAAVGLAIAAPSLVLASHDAMPALDTARAYACYTAAVQAGSLAGALWSLVDARSLRMRAVVSLGVAVGAQAAIAVGNVAILFLVATAISALAETRLAVELGARVQSLPARACAELLLRFRGALAAIAAGGLVVNVLIAPHLPPSCVVALASGLGAALALLTTAWRRSTNRGGPSSRRPEPRTPHGKSAR